jgi:hypothetical protein
MMTHTKGPWEFTNGEVTTKQEQGRSYRRIAAVQDYGLGSEPEVDKANGNLCAAAPDLLAACEYAMEWINNIADADPDVLLNAMPNNTLGRTFIRAAIAKAKGL